MDPLLYEQSGSIATITLHRPDKFNAFDGPLSEALLAALERARKDASVRCIVLTGAGRAFSAGQDLQEVTGPNAPTVPQILKERLNPIILQLRSLDKPVIAAVNGVAAGAGANIALACDIVIAARSASFIQAFSKIGLIPDSGGTWFLPRLIGWGKASALFLLGEKVSAEQAERMGMIYEAVEDEAFPARVQALATTLSQMPTRALALTKAALNSSLISNLPDQLHDEEILQERAARTEDFREGVQAFVEKRNPQFKGR